MTEAQDKAFIGSIPEIYARYLVPLIFDPYARNLAERVKRSGASRVLETAAGTGVVTRELASALPDSARIVVTDLNQAMLDVAQASLTADQRFEWRQADALALPFDNETFDAVVCQFGVMFFPDKLQGFREAHRVLRPSGTFLFTVWDGLEHNAFPDVIEEALARFFPDDPPRFLSRTPYGYHDRDAIRQQLRAAGFSNVEIETVAYASRCGSPRDPAVGFCQGTPLYGEIVARGPSHVEEAVQHAGEALRQRFGNGPIEGQIQALVITATR